MIRTIHFLMKQKLLVNLAVVLICVVGLMSLGGINREIMPDTNFDMVSITTVYPGASPDEAEQLITIPIEKRLREIEGIDKVRAYNIENVSVVVIYLEDRSENRDSVVQDIKDAVELVNNLPADAEDPVVEEIKVDSTPVVDVAIYGDKKGFPYQRLRDLADDLEDYIYEIDGVAKVGKEGFYDREYLVEVDPSALTRYRIGMNTVVNTLRNRNLDLPGGSLRVGEEEYVLRTKGQFRSTEEVRDTVIMANDVGFVTRIRDVARVTDTFEEADVLTRFNGRKAIKFTIYKKGSVDEIDLSNKIREQMAAYISQSPKDIHIEFFNDVSRHTRDRLNSVLQNGGTGFVLLFCILLLLLGMRMAGLVSLSIPLSFMVAFVSMKQSGLTLNVISMFGLIMVIGMIVDFSIVVSENSHRYVEEGLGRSDAIEKGVAEVFWPVTVTLLCISAAFAPLLFLSGMMGKFTRAIPIVLITCLVASWFIAMFVLPTYLNMFMRKSAPSADSTGRFRNLYNSVLCRVRERFPRLRQEDADTCRDLKQEDMHYEQGAFGRVQKSYKALLESSLEHRYRTVGILLLLLVISLSLVGLVGFQFVPNGGEETLTVKAVLPQGKNLQANLREMRKVEEIIGRLPDVELDDFYSRVGEETGSWIDPKPGEATHKTTFSIHLSPEDDRERSAYDIKQWLRDEILAAQEKGAISGDILFKFEVEQHGPPVGKPVNIEIRGKDFAVLEKIAGEYMDFLHTLDGVRDITLDLEEGKQEYRYSINEEMAAQTGVSVFDVAMAINASFEGAVATSVNREEEEIDVRVRFPEWARKRMKSLNEVMISNNRGGLIPLDMVTRVKKQPGYSMINRLNYRRIAQVQADVDVNTVTSVEANRLLAEKFSDIEKRYPGYEIAYGGEQEDTDESMIELSQLFLVALLVIFMVLAVFMRSLILPVVVMAAIPFSLVGVIFALITHGQPLSFMGTLGVFSLAGVIVSNTLVLVQFINNLRDQGLPLREALTEAGVIRLRPVILTTGTTVLGLVPAIYGLGGKDYFIAPLALSFGYGLIFATFITLVLIPCFYYLAEDAKGFVSRLLAHLGIEMRSTIYEAVPSSLGAMPADVALPEEVAAQVKKKKGRMKN